MLLTVSDLADRWGIGRVSAHKRTKRPDFPAPTQHELTHRMRAWREEDVALWENEQGRT